MMLKLPLQKNESDDRNTKCIFRCLSRYMSKLVFLFCDSFLASFLFPLLPPQKKHLVYELKSAGLVVRFQCNLFLLSFVSSADKNQSGEFCRYRLNKKSGEYNDASCVCGNHIYVYANIKPYRVYIYTIYTLQYYTPNPLRSVKKRFSVYTVALL